jgi:hypothetical protein
MTHLPETVYLPEFASPGRQHSDPPQLWAGVIIASLGIHAIFLAATLPFILKMATSQPQVASVPIELIDLPAAQQSTPSEATGAIAPTSPAALPPSTPATASTQPPATGAPPSTTNPATNPPLTSDRLPISQPESDRPPASQPNIEPSSQPSPASPPSLSPPLPPTSDTRETTDPPTTAPPANSGEPTTNNPPNESTGTPSPAGSGDPDLPGVPVPSTITPTTITANFSSSVIPASENPKDIPEQPAVPVATSQDFPLDPQQLDCTDTPEANQFLGQPISFQVTVEADGQVSNVQPREPIPNQEYAHLAACLLQRLPFRPAMNDGQPVTSNYSVVTVTLQRK